jgi:hypothetical protein
MEGVSVTQTTLDFDAPPRFNGPSYNAARDNARLGAQFIRIFNLMADGQWRTLREISEATGDPEASASAQLRHARKSRFGGHTVERQHVGNGLYRYQLTVSTSR